MGGSSLVVTIGDVSGKELMSVVSLNWCNWCRKCPKLPPPRVSKINSVWKIMNSSIVYSSEKELGVKKNHENWSLKLDSTGVLSTNRSRLYTKEML
jgi:hypothetical protein